MWTCVRLSADERILLWGLFWVTSAELSYNCGNVLIVMAEGCQITGADVIWKNISCFTHTHKHP